MASVRSSAASRDVFLNVPFDAGYERLFVALIVCVVAARLVPRCALQLPERGEGQFKRILTILSRCSLSIHDLSRANRFNMPFELGLALALRESHPSGFILLESRSHRLARRLSDVRIEPLVHGNGPLQLIAALADNLGGPRPPEVEAVYRDLIHVLPALKRNLRTRSVFGKALFEELVSGATEKAVHYGLYPR